MLVRTVTLTNARGRSRLTVDLGPRLTILVGPNGAGKTTVIEALALVLQGTVIRGGIIRDFIKHGEDLLRIEVVLQSSARTTVTAAAAFTRQGERKLTADGAQLEDASRWREMVPVRTFIPDDLRLIKGSPRRRREYVDGLTAHRDPAHRSTLRQYEEALGQRNSLLRGYTSSFDGRQFVPWERILAQTGAVISRGRARRLQEFVGPFQELHRDLTGDESASIRLVYRSNVADLDVEAYETRLAEMREADRRRTFTHLGPHRDDLRLIRRNLDMRDCASQGEQRAAILTLVLAEWAETGTGEERPLLLLDDVMSELDEERRRALVAIVQRGGQTVVTTTDLRYFTDEEIAAATVIKLTSDS
ncbi:MAG: DNA replication/repair protein RecF [Thermoleophilia bacterium]